MTLNMISLDHMVGKLIALVLTAIVIRMISLRNFRSCAISPHTASGWYLVG